MFIVYFAMPKRLIRSLKKKKNFVLIAITLEGGL